MSLRLSFIVCAAWIAAAARGWCKAKQDDGEWQDGERRNMMILLLVMKIMMMMMIC